MLKAVVLPGALVEILLSATGSAALLLAGTCAPGGEDLAGDSLSELGSATLLVTGPGPWGRDPGA